MKDLSPIPIKYSKYAISLDKIFKNSSVESFHYNLKNPKKLKKIQLNMFSTDNEKRIHDNL